MKRVNSLYIHIPFCTHLCEYCDFTKMFYLRPFVNKYIKFLVKEIDNLKNQKFKTIYIGGGTPSSLSAYNLELLLASLNKHLKKNTEFTIEVNVENLNLKKLHLFKEYGINRISIGVQTFNDQLLKSINRHHSARQVKYWIKQIKKMGFNNINIDLIYGLPNQTMELFKNDLKEAISLDINHISSYSLTISKGTMFYNRGVKEVDEDTSRMYYDALYSYLTKHGFKRYEVSNFAKNKAYSKHNLTYWNDENYIGLGLGAHGYVNNIRYQNTTNINDYLKGNTIQYKEELSNNNILEEFLMLNLRKYNGFLISNFNKHFGDIKSHKLYKIIKELEQEKMLKITNYRIYPTYEGMMLLDTILLRLFMGEE